MKSLGIIFRKVRIRACNCAPAGIQSLILSDMLERVGEFLTNLSIQNHNVLAKQTLFGLLLDFEESRTKSTVFNPLLNL